MPKQVTFSLEAMEALVRKVVSSQGLKLKANGALVPANRDGKSDRSIANETAAIRAFKKAGFGAVTPHKDVMTFNRWLAAGFRPKEGSKSLKVKNMRLFHQSQVRPLTSADKQAMAEKAAQAEPQVQ